MAWIESHQSLLTHRKTLRAAALLRVDKYKLIGHLHALWWWGIDSADDDGNLGQVTAIELADAAGWPTKKGTAFVDALVSAGFLEQTGAAYALHNWYQYVGKLNARRAANTERMRDARAQHVHPLPTNHHQPAPSGANQPTKPTTTTTNQPTAQEVLEGRPLIFRLYEQLLGRGVSPLVAQRLQEVEREWSPECVEHCFQEAAEAGARSIKLVYTILDRHKQEGCYAGKPQRASVGANLGQGPTGADEAYLSRLGIGEREFVVDP